MPKKPELRAAELLRAMVPGNVRLQLSVYVQETRQYHPVPGRAVRVAVDTIEQAEALWVAVFACVNATVETWPAVGDAITEGYGVQTSDD
jgi:hypothetical protein